MATCAAVRYDHRSRQRRDHRLARTHITLQEPVHRLGRNSNRLRMSFTARVCALVSAKGKALILVASHSSETGKRRASTCFQSRFWRSTPICRKKTSSKARRSPRRLQVAPAYLGNAHAKAPAPPVSRCAEARTFSGSGSTTAGAQYVTTWWMSPRSHFCVIRAVSG